MEVLETECLIIGSGLSGSSYALSGTSNGLKCIMISSEKVLNESNSNYAQGGIVYPREEDAKALYNDLNRASHNTFNPKAYEFIKTYGEKFVREILIDKIDVPFDRDERGNLLYTKEAAHGTPRIIYSKDKTGEAIIKAFHKKLENEKNLTILENHIAIDLLTLSHSSKRYLDKYKPLTTVGAYVLDQKENKVKAIVARKTIIATGGLGRIFLNTTNTEDSFGSGIAMAYRVGARIMDMEYIQFHPTVFYKKGAPPFLISEAVRGEGGILINSNGEPFMKKYHKDGSLAPRDEVARAIKFETLKTNSNCVYIDLSKMKGKFIKERFPKIFEKCLEHGIDITKTHIPVVPAAHYFCGGVYTNIYGNTNIENLNVIGEAACTGLHGANRLASTSLLECLVMGTLCAQKDAESIHENHFTLPEIKNWQSPSEEPDPILISQDLSLIRNTMWNYVGLIRTTKGLERAKKVFAELKIDIDAFYSNCFLSKELLNLRNSIQIAMLITYAANRNKESKGCHFRKE
jgi:L-aspartate oxidase